MQFFSMVREEERKYRELEALCGPMFPLDHSSVYGEGSGSGNVLSHLIQSPLPALSWRGLKRRCSGKEGRGVRTAKPYSLWKRRSEKVDKCKSEVFVSQFFPNEERRRQWVYNCGILSWKRLCSLVILKIQREGRRIRIYRGLCDLQKHIQYYISLCLEDIQCKYKHFYLQKISYVYQWWGSGLVEKDKETVSSSAMPSYRWGGRGPERTTEPARDRTRTSTFFP